MKLSARESPSFLTPRLKFRTTSYTIYSADALEIEPADLLKASMFPDQIKSDPKNSETTEPIRLGGFAVSMHKSV